MVLTIEVIVQGQQRPRVGSPLRVQVRDTSLADAAAVLVKEATGTVQGQHGQLLDTVELEIDRLPRHSTIWAHVDVDRDGRVTAGDFITTAAYPVPPGENVRLQVSVKQV